MDSKLCRQLGLSRWMLPQLPAGAARAGGAGPTGGGAAERATEPKFMGPSHTQQLPRVLCLRPCSGTSQGQWDPALVSAGVQMRGRKAWPIRQGRQSHRQGPLYQETLLCGPRSCQLCPKREHWLPSQEACPH